MIYPAETPALPTGVWSKFKLPDNVKKLSLILANDKRSVSALSVLAIEPELTNWYGITI